ncbi:hypothetical protein RvY_12771-2 [Ramazzottius varieornatus]|uniref:Osteopetrosis-associated transmembrane protein 1 n=1 Tax=Ramazzottius varieornatus TaxID=947166 RepID=A0A1D1VKM3_RAMVA|nr:hypothetical protein RvY_12771-2 [Ramazzottius varieornatus]
MRYYPWFNQTIRRISSLVYLILAFGFCTAKVSLSDIVSITKDLAVDWSHLTPFLACGEDGNQIAANCLRPPTSDSHTQTDDVHPDDPQSIRPDPSLLSRRVAKIGACQEYLTIYGGASSSFLGCAVNFSRPILLCEKCVDQYLHSQEAHIDYSEAMNEDGISCQDVVYGSDLIEVVDRINTSITALWDNANCAYCFNSYSISHGTVVYEYSENLITFTRKHQNLSECFNHNGIKLDRLLNKMENLTNATIVCEECYPMYKDLTDFFLKNYTEDISRTCMDVVDLMNQTRRMWSRYFRCQDRNPDMFYVWTVVIVIFSSTVVFYIAMLFNSTFEAYVIRGREFELSS